MTAMPFDTLKFARALREKAKLSPEQAEGFAVAIAEAIQGDLATKADIQALGKDIQAGRVEVGQVEQGLKGEIDDTKQSLKADIRETELRLEAELRKAELRLETKIEQTRTEIHASKAEIIKWMFGTIGFQTLIILGAVIALAKAL